MEQVLLTFDIFRRLSAPSAASTRFDDTETVTSEKAQLESLVIEQQLSLFKAGELYGEYQASETQDTSDEKAIVPAKKRVASIATDMKPAGLELYQEKSLEQVYTTSVETERVAAVLKIASPFADHLMKQWTLVDRPEVYTESRGSLAVQSPNGIPKPSLRRIASQPEGPEAIKARNATLNPRSPHYRMPSVEDDSEEEKMSGKFSTRTTVRAILPLPEIKGSLLNNGSFTN